MGRSRNGWTIVAVTIATIIGILLGAYAGSTDAPPVPVITVTVDPNLDSDSI